jgi:hypothetical protein
LMRKRSKRLLRMIVEDVLLRRRFDRLVFPTDDPLAPETIGYLAARLVSFPGATIVHWPETESCGRGLCLRPKARLTVERRRSDVVEGCAADGGQRHERERTLFIAARITWRAPGRK